MKSRWAYLAKADKKGFVSSIHIISLAALLQYLLFRELPGLVFSAFGFFVNELGILDSDFFRFWPPEELGYLFFNLMSLVTTLVACGATAAFVVFCEKKFAPENRPATDRVSYRFKLPKHTPALLVAGMCVMEFSMLAYNTLNYLLERFFGIFPIAPQGAEYYFPKSAAGIIVYFVSLVVAPALAEEFVCRYAMLNALKKYGNAFAIAATSVFFGFAHARMGAFVYATAMGVFLAYITLKTGSIWFAVILHALVNFTSFFFQFLAFVPFLYEESIEIIYLLFRCAISLFCAIYLVTLSIKKRYGELKPPNGYVHIPTRQKLFFFFNAGSIVFFVLTMLKSAEGYRLGGR